jgi:DNA-binding transcriptional LysR family regulator
MSPPLARHHCVRLEALQGQAMLRREQGSTTRAAFERVLAKHEVSPRMLMEIGSREALREAVARGIGIALPDAFLDAGALPTLHDRYGISTEAVARQIKGWL